MLELLLKLRGDRRHRRHGSGNILLRNLTVASELRLELSWLRLKSWVSSKLLLKRCLVVSGRLRSKRSRLLRLLRWLTDTTSTERASILLGAGANAVPAQERIRIRIHFYGWRMITSVGAGDGNGIGVGVGVVVGDGAGWRWNLLRLGPGIGGQPGRELAVRRVACRI